MKDSNRALEGFNDICLNIVDHIATETFFCSISCGLINPRYTVH